MMGTRMRATAAMWRANLRSAVTGAPIAAKPATTVTLRLAMAVTACAESKPAATGASMRARLAMTPTVSRPTRAATMRGGSLW